MEIIRPITQHIGNAFRFALLFIAILCNSGCTHNNGDIGPWFGTWQLEEISVDGIASAGYERNIFWKFQSNILEMVRVSTEENLHSYEVCYATWSESDNHLYIDFRHNDDNNPAEDGENGTGAYAPFAETHLPQATVTELNINKQTGSKAILSFQSTTDGKTYRYTLSKQG